jgi:hypothetical protein
VSAWWARIIWDLWLMRDLDPKSMGINYDVGHATSRGGLGGWINSFKIAGSHLRGIAVKVSRARTRRARGKRSGSRLARAW